jgi:hypothetical protein
MLENVASLFSFWPENALVLGAFSDGGTARRALPGCSGACRRSASASPHTPARRTGEAGSASPTGAAVRQGNRHA